MLPPKPERGAGGGVVDDEDDTSDETDVSPVLPSVRPGVAVLTAAGGPTPGAALSVAEAASAGTLELRVEEPKQATRTTTDQATPQGHPQSQAAQRAPPGVAEGWFALEASPKYEAEVLETLKRLDRPAKRPLAPGALGEIYVRVSWGDGIRRPGAASAAALLRPAAYRDILGTLQARWLFASCVASFMFNVCLLRRCACWTRAGCRRRRAAQALRRRRA